MDDFFDVVFDVILDALTPRALIWLLATLVVGGLILWYVTKN